MFIHGYAAKQPKLKVLSIAESHPSWFADDKIRLKPDFGVKFLTSVLVGIKRSIDKDRLVSVSSSMELDMQ